MENKSQQHVQLPNNMTASGELTPKDLLIYVSIKRYMNNETREAFPSLETIMKHSSSSKPTVRKCIESLKSKGYISIHKEGRKNVYKFSNSKNFEPFSYEFLDKEDLTANEKAYLIASQQHMYKDIDSYGKITYTDSKLADKINLSYHSVKKYDKSLLDKGYLTIVKTDQRDSETGLIINEKMFHLDELGQAIVFALNNHEGRIVKTEESIEAMQRKIDAMQRQIDIFVKAEKERHGEKNEDIKL